ncbi:M48 family metallopeptidase [Caldicellulosiruptor acetigenus]|uniref:M48 family metallopeptidase n=1 Tax=Caldicellulosiruptor acetigenus TaxID=301953 RepID=UPI000425494F|nr:M48 family metallopeptidase [Caldicellulosiruptor acetigenus]WAM36159.1 M48 family metallopeptidase [Caldicellulosiruptor acetigenus]
MKEVNLKVSSEKFLFGVLAFFSIISYIVLIVSMVGLVYLILIALTILITNGIFIGNIKGNAVKLSPQQLGDIYNEYEQVARQMGFDEVPDIYLIQGGGLLNAFATRFIGRNFVIIYADVLELAYQQGMDEVKFILAHELGHLRANHLKYRWLIQLGFMIPLLGQAYLRACEYTADRYGAYYSPKGAVRGLILLAAGKKLYNNIDIEQILKQAREDKGFWVNFSELFSSHPHLVKRIEAVTEFVRYISPAQENSEVFSVESV